jgi:hypothetical protein
MLNCQIKRFWCSLMTFAASSFIAGFFLIERVNIDLRQLNCDWKFHPYFILIPAHQYMDEKTFSTFIVIILSGS